MTVSITNRTPFPFDVSLYHDIFCVKTGTCSCTPVDRTSAQQMADGTVRSKRVQRRLPSTLSFAPAGKPGSTRGDLLDAVAELPQVKFAEKHRQIIVRRTVSQPQATPAQEPAASTSRSGRRSSARNRNSNRS